jgi:predicted nuclease of predicted toxin-antitoxin system
MDFVLDENVPASVGEMLIRNGHGAKSIREYLPEGSTDPLVATIAEKINATLISFDGDFEKIAPRVPAGARRRFKKLCRIWLQCSEFQAASRLELALSLVESERQLADTRHDLRMLIWVSSGYIKTHR